ncbi:zinc finger RNA-binding protein-like [Platysternon megacephalum]|uniref:Zinc finger RNA-binding protein-like n=1 Tax=Platysternon megacephalum TaxID=55544 RepID=A0A4D9E399_9SAUR|nr:zinc finger RNA-binding protein-like [Platysternon megacephalum]
MVKDECESHHKYPDSQEKVRDLETQGDNQKTPIVYDAKHVTSIDDLREEKDVPLVPGQLEADPPPSSIPAPDVDDDWPGVPAAVYPEEPDNAWTTPGRRSARNEKPKIH